jgi:hypothetical protein
MKQIHKMKPKMILHLKVIYKLVKEIAIQKISRIRAYKLMIMMKYFINFNFLNFI